MRSLGQMLANNSVHFVKLAKHVYIAGTMTVALRNNPLLEFVRVPGRRVYALYHTLPHLSEKYF